MLIFDKTDLQNNTLIIQNDNGSITCIPEEGCTSTEKFLFDEFRAKYPEGKPVAPIDPQTLTPTEIELLKQQISHLEDYILQKELNDITN